MIDNLMWIVCIVAIIGSAANIYKKRWCFIVWGITNLAWVAYNLYKIQHAQAFLWCVHFGTCVWGYLEWSKKKEAS